MPRATKLISILFALLVGAGFSRPAQAKTVNAASCKQSDVQAAINSAANGDTVNIPDGSCSWTGTINLTIAITLQGVSAPGVCSYPNGGTNCGLQITDNNTTVCTNHGAPCQPDGSNLLIINKVPGFRTVLGNMSFHPGTGVGNYILLRGSGGPPTLFHDISMENSVQMINQLQWMQQGGVIWNFDLYSTNNLAGPCNTVVGAAGNGGLFVNSPYGWDNDSSMGMLDKNGDINLYIEDSRFYQVDQTPDVGDNGRVVLRHMTIDGTAGLTHGITGPTGGRHVEYYQNNLLYSFGNRNMNRYFWLRSGTIVMTQNNIQWINSGCYPNKPSFTAIVEGAMSNANAHGCCTITATGNSCWHQAGTGAQSSPTFNPSNLYTSQFAAGGVGGDNHQVIDPVYIWNNTGTGQGSAHYGTNESGLGDQCHNTNPNTGQEYKTADFYVSGIHYFYDDSSNPNNGAKPGWVPYTYPHPLRSGSSGPAPAPPTNPAAVVH